MAKRKSISSRKWHYHPELPLQDPSVFRWPVDLVRLLRWLGHNWLTLSERVILVLMATLLWLFAYPTLEAAREFSPGWILQIWAINMATMLVIAGGLHWYFYIKRGQAKTLKFDGRDQMSGSRLWNFSDQVYDNMFWSLTSGVLQLTAFQSFTWWLMANGHIPSISLIEHPIWFALSLILLPIWSAFHFYCIHRLLHWPPLYRHVHSLHHRNVNIGPWSGLSMHPVEHLLYLSSICIHWVIPTHPITLVFHVLYLGPGAAMTHTGYEDLLIKDKRKLALGTFYHQLHHRLYDCNYGNQEMPWDRWFGTFHDGTEAGDERMQQRRKYSRQPLSR